MHAKGLAAMSLRSGLLAVATLLLLLLPPQAAHAWRCARVPDNSGYQTGPGLHWSKRQLTYALNSNGTTTLPAAQTAQTLQLAFSTWQNVTIRAGEDSSCPNVFVDANSTKTTDLTFTQGPLTDQSYVGYNYLNPDDNVNVVLFRDERWPYALAGASTEMVAMTTTTFNAITGEILDADIEFNAFDYAFSLGDTNVQYDLLNIAVHEVGHFLGFGHSDDPNATMFETTAYGDTQKRALSCDDAAILWYRYPAAQPTLSCVKGQAVGAECGFCAAPGVVYQTPRLDVTASYDGVSGCSCQSATDSLWAAMACFGWALWRWRIHLMQRFRRG